MHKHLIVEHYWMFWFGFLMHKDKPVCDASILRFHCYAQPLLVFFLYRKTSADRVPAASDDICVSLCSLGEAAASIQRTMLHNMRGKRKKKSFASSFLSEQRNLS